MSVLIKNAKILTMDESFTEYECADILVQGTKIVEIGRGLTPAEGEHDLRVIDGSSKLVMPGLVNGHLHSPGNFMKGMLDDLPLEIFMLYEVPPLSDTPLDPRHIYIRTMLSNMEMLKLGVTSVHDDAYYIPYPTADTINSLMQAYVDCGIRAVATLDQPNVIEYEKYPYLHDILPEDLRQKMANAPIMPEVELLELYQHLIRKWHKACDGRVKAGVSISAPQRVTVSYFEALAEISQSMDLPFDIHILETKLQRVLGEEKYKKSLVQYVKDLGFLIEQAMVIHAIWVDDADIEALANSGCSVAHNPLCNLRLGSGVMQFRKLRDKGIPICLGSDEMNTDDTANMWGVGKIAGLIHTLTNPDYQKWPKAREILTALTSDGARAMRNQGSVGRLAPGYEADLILLDLNTLAFTPMNDIYRQLVYSENGSSVLMTMVAGRIVMEDGRLLTINEEDIKAEVREIMRSYQKEVALINEAAATLEPYYREMYLRAASKDVGMNRWVGDAWKDIKA